MQDAEFIKLHEDAILPVRETAGSVGFDLVACINEPVTVKFGEGVTRIHTGVSVKLPPGTYGRIAGRSGLALRNGIAIAGGVIDPDYTGELIVLAFTTSTTPFTFYNGDRIAQIIIERAIIPEISGLYTNTHDGFGSTGL